MRKPAANSRPWLPRRPQGFSRKENSMPEYHTHRWTRLSRAFRRQHPLCAECQRKGRIAEAEVTDHIIPPWVEGVDFWDASNWQPLCRRCNLAKGARDRIKWPLDTRKGEGVQISRRQSRKTTLTPQFAHVQNFQKLGDTFRSLHLHLCRSCRKSLRARKMALAENRARKVINRARINIL